MSPGDGPGGFAAQVVAAMLDSHALPALLSTAQSVLAAYHHLAGQSLHDDEADPVRMVDI